MVKSAELRHRAKFRGDRCKMAPDATCRFSNLPHDESFHQVWSWYKHPLPSYSVIAADTLRDLMTLTFHPLTSVSSHTWRVTWSPSVKILRLSIVGLWVLISPVGYHWQCVWSHCPCTVSRDLCVGGGKVFTLGAEFHYPIRDAERSEAGRRPAADLLARASSLPAS